MADNKNQMLLKNMMYIGIGTVFTKIISFLMIPFYTNWLSPEEYGVFDLLASYVLLCVPFITLQLEQAIFRFSVDSHKDGKLYYRNSFFITLVTSIVIIIVSIIVMYIIGYSKYSLSFIAYFLMLAFYNQASEYLRGVGELVSYAIYNIIVGIITSGISVILVYFLKTGINGLLFAFAAGYGISMILIVFRYKLFHISKKEFSFSYDIAKKMLCYSIPLIPNAISWWITNVSNRTIIRIFLGSYYNGLFAIGTKIPTMLSMIFGIFNLSFQDVAIQTLKEDNRNRYYNELIHSVIRILFLGGTVIVASSPIIYSLVNEKYRSGIYTVPFLLGGAIFLSIAQYIGDIMLAFKETKSVGISTLAAALANIVLNIILIVALRIVGVALATFLSYFIMFELRLIKNKDIIDCKSLHIKIGFYMIIYTLISIISMYMVDNLRVVIITCVVTIIIFIYFNFELISTIMSKVFKKGKIK